MFFRNKKETCQPNEVSQPLIALIARDPVAKHLQLPKYGRPGDVAMDLPVLQDDTIPPHAGKDIRTGVYVVPPDGYYFRVVGKGSSAKRGLSFSLEIIDPGYRGEIILHPWNASDKGVPVSRGQCIAQLELLPVTPYTWREVPVTELGETERGAGRMGSTGSGI